MKIVTKTRNLELTNDLEDFVETRISKLKKFVDILKEETPERGKPLAEVFVEIERETEHHKKGKIFLVKVRVAMPGKVLMAQHRADDVFKAVNGAKEELKIEIEKYKFKHISKNRKNQRRKKTKII